MRQTHVYRLVYSLGMLMLVASAQPGDWSATDETTVDLERTPPRAAAYYQPPRGARHYRYDETDVDLAIPLPAAPETPQAAPNPVSDDTPVPAPASEEELPQ